MVTQNSRILHYIRNTTVIRGAKAQHHEIFYVQLISTYHPDLTSTCPSPRSSASKTQYSSPSTAYSSLCVSLAAAEGTAVRGHAKGAFEDMTAAEAVILTI